MVKILPIEFCDGVYYDKYARSTKILTVNLVPDKKVYDEYLVNTADAQYRNWDIYKSKLGAGIANGIKFLGFKEGDTILYLGASTGTTVSHVSDIVGKTGCVFALDFAPVTTRPLVFLAEDRKNIVPILADANQPLSYVHKVPQVNFLFQDIAQKNQVEIFLKNMMFLQKGGFAMLSLKCRSIDVTKRPSDIFKIVLEQLKKKVEVIDFKSIEPYEKDHYLFLVRKNY
ncbi:MAG: fibrillarin-like rRNA/tRNA 2'-O-methyltransferase [Candidatus Woesearchaeota archaeon]|jgi:fibrillarin-like pre-rRNA processing protein